MPSQKQIKDDITEIYTNLNTTIDRYNFINNIEQHIIDMKNQYINSISYETKNTTLNKIIKIISEQSGCMYTILHVAAVVPDEDILIQKIISELELDSLDEIEIVMAIEEEFNIEIPDYEIENFKTIRDLINFINSGSF
ncbi:Acyl carrier protein [Yersinia phage fHe-Yen9-03]|uniref:Acyl carrier protein n=1 Tax=Yersinia phage fHe-Yen9-03 TaxID=2052743 RepID=A0A2C9CY51_9CAUD|nr:Acyl carrier protein [Yersinia phage fHe-Yen9-03]